MTISYSKDFLKVVHTLSSVRRTRLKQRIELLIDEPHNSQLHNHKLSGEWSGYRSINITGDLRAVFTLSKSEIYFVALGSHAQLYK